MGGGVWPVVAWWPLYMLLTLLDFGLGCLFVVKVFTLYVPFVMTLVLSIGAIVRIKRSGGQLKGMGMAIWAMVVFLGFAILHHAAETPLLILILLSSLFG